MDQTNGVICELDFYPTYDNSYGGMAKGIASGAGGLMKAGIGKLWGGKKKEKKDDGKIKPRGDDFNITIK